MSSFFKLIFWKNALIQNFIKVQQSKKFPETERDIIALLSYEIKEAFAVDELIITLLLIITVIVST